MSSLKSQPVLNIVIPTYNRIEYIKLTLNSILGEKPGDSISITVIDNCSNDGTWEWLQYFSTKFDIHIYKNNTNLGIEGNIIESLKTIVNGYVWMLSDHMLVLPGSIKKIADYLKENQSAVFGCIPIQKYSDSTLTKPKKITLGQLNEDELDMLFLGTSNISGMILKKTLVIESLRQIYRFSYFGFPHLGVYTKVFLDTEIVLFPTFLEFIPAKVSVRHVSYNIFNSRYLGYPRAKNYIASLNKDLRSVKKTKSNKVLRSSFIFDSIVSLVSRPDMSPKVKDFVECFYLFKGTISWIAVIFSILTILPFPVRRVLIKFVLTKIGKWEIVENEINIRLYSQTIKE